MNKEERNAKIFKYRDSGMTFREIGRAFGISVERARQIYLNKKQKEEGREEGFFYAFGNRIGNSLKRADIETEQDLYDFVKNGGHIRNIGQDSIDKINSIIGFKIVLKKHGQDTVVCLKEDDNE